MEHESARTDISAATSRRVGNETGTGTYFEVLGTPSARPPLLFIHGGGASGVCWRRTADGRPGWADRLADDGWECWVIDWPGSGRSGNLDPISVSFAHLVTGVERILVEEIGRPTVLIPHSMGGAVAWKVAESPTGLVAGIVGIAASAPGNLTPKSEVISDDGRRISVRFVDSGVVSHVDREALWFYSDEMIDHQALAGSTHLSREAGRSHLHALAQGISPTVLLQRMGTIPGLPVITRPEALRGLQIRLIAGDQDPAHLQSTETRTAELLRSWQADAQLVWLPDRGIVGNGHFLMLEDNSDEILAIVTEQLDVLSGSR